LRRFLGTFAFGWEIPRLNRETPSCGPYFGAGGKIKKTLHMKAPRNPANDQNQIPGIVVVISPPGELL